MVPVDGAQPVRLFSATAVWVTVDQVWLSIPEAITQLQSMAHEGEDGMALCYIPDTKLYFSYPANGPHVLVLARDHDQLNRLALGSPANFSAFEATSYELGAQGNVGLTSRLRFGLDHTASQAEE